MHHTAVIIDDSTLERFIAERIITNSGLAAEVKGFSSAVDALGWLRSLEEDSFPGIVFVDLQMPVMTGFDFLDEYLLLPEACTSRAKVIMLSSSLADEDFARIKKYPIISKFLPKPLKEEMIAALDL